MAKDITVVLNQIQRVEGVSSILVVDREGLLIAETGSRSNNGAPVEKLASAFAVAIHNFEQSAGDIGDVEQVIVEKENEDKLMMWVNEKYILAVVTEKQANLGMVRMEMREAIESLNELLLT